jgi:hypothetical protein
MFVGVLVATTAVAWGSRVTVQSPHRSSTSSSTVSPRHLMIGTS